jgi:xanthine dehydrogenase accessory factor
MDRGTDVLDFVNDLKAHGEAFALATVVRTVSATAAKAGAKAVIRTDGSISAGWIGGGCARAAVLNAARLALADGQARLVSVQPADVLNDQGLHPGDRRDGIQFARNMCPSHGTMDVFVEPVLPRPGVVVCGGSPVAVAVAELAARFGFAVTVAARLEDHANFAEPDARLHGFDLTGLSAATTFAVVATQGAGDEATLRAAVQHVPGYVAFVGSQRKAAAVREALAASGANAEALSRVRAPAGLDIGAVTPEEIALSIVAEMVEVRRRGQAVRPPLPMGRLQG